MLRRPRELVRQDNRGQGHPATTAVTSGQPHTPVPPLLPRAASNGLPAAMAGTRRQMGAGRSRTRPVVPGPVPGGQVTAPLGGRGELLLTNTLPLCDAGSRRGGEVEMPRAGSVIPLFLTNPPAVPWPHGRRRGGRDALAAPRRPSQPRSTPTPLRPRQQRRNSTQDGILPQWQKKPRASDTGCRPRRRRGCRREGNASHAPPP